MEQRKPALINVRGCNGSGKTTVLRSLLEGCVSRIVEYDAPDHKPIPVTFVEDSSHASSHHLKLAIIGNYQKDGCAGLDRVKTQAASKYVIDQVSLLSDLDAVLFEGVLVSTIFEPWLKFSKEKAGLSLYDKKPGAVIWAFLDTPIEVCLARIQERNGGKPIKEEQVRAKHRTILGVKNKAIQAGERVEYLDYELATESLFGILFRLKAERTQNPADIARAAAATALAPLNHESFNKAEQVLNEETPK